MGRINSLLILLILGLVAGCSNGNADNGSGDGEPDNPGVLITTQQASRDTVAVTESTIGRLTSKTAPTLTAEVSGTILEIHAEEGDEVTQGQPLLRIDPEPYELALAQARTDVRRLQASLRTRRRELERNAELLEDGYVTQSRFDTLESEVESLEEDLEAARSRVESTEIDLRHTTVEAPVDAAIDARLVSVGDYTAPGEPLFRLISQDLLRVRLPFPETVAQRLEVGQPVRLRAPVAEGTVNSTISELRPGLADQSRTFEAIVNVENPGGWRRGGSVNATVTVAERDSIVVPATAVIQRPAGEVVYVIRDGTAHERRVEVGERLPARLEIRDGLEAGEVIAVDGAGFLSDGATIRTDEE
ncbi:efflux RND transporter periplasmic adaptor subunit [Aquisalimonas lutea]|uniref:efflux RND transporter periplasmic adaptor subunit n=1 Tax=Aquisalimonas lutea TaxID=1327750 RepID=UPI0025B32941|nr:efflux RND transporter periplasmic adaptor subunit [Aquisalimonas lutea]MDN3516791.1 efflux RND transporter periplasmic adaptor subunit [Aquisalimonas lutea]